MVPEGVTAIGDEAFYNCKKLKDIRFPSTLKSLGKSTFYQCGFSTTEPFYVFLPDELEEMSLSGRNGSFVNKSNNLIFECNLGELPRALCKDSSSFEFTVPGWHDFLFYYSDFTESTETDPSHKENRLYLKWYLGSAAQVTVPDFVEVVRGEAFCHEQPDGKNTTMTSLVFQEGLVGFEMNAVNNCTALTSVVIPEGMTEIAVSAFKGCSALTRVTFPVHPDQHQNIRISELRNGGY